MTKVLPGRYQKEVLKKSTHRDRPKGAKSMFSFSKTIVFTMARVMQKAPKMTSKWRPKRSQLSKTASQKLTQKTPRNNVPEVAKITPKRE